MTPILLVMALQAQANEGMWRPEQIPQLTEELEAMGVKAPEKFAALDQAPLNAIVDMDHCSGAFVSADGLVATAYHCISDALQYASKPGEDLFEGGFHAPTREEERSAGPTLVLKVTVSVEDVGQQVLAGTRKLEGKLRFDQIAKNQRDIVARCEADAGLHCEVASYGQGAEYQLVKQVELRDVRLVYAPPLDVGYFGGDRDNWQWPRHSGDFAFVRVYADKDNVSDHFATDNRPYAPAGWLPVATTGPKPGDSVMVAGYPGGTFRWRTAAEFDFAQEDDYPRRVRTARDVLAVLQLQVDRWPDLSSKVAPHAFNLNNDVQYLDGNLQAFRRSGLQSRKWAFEQDLGAWIAADPLRAERFGDVLDTVHRLQAEEAATAERDHVAGELRDASVMLESALTLYELALESRKADKQRRAGFQNRDRPDIAARFEAMDAGYDERVDRALLRYFLLRATELPSGLRIAELDAWLEREGSGTAEQRVDAALAKLYAHEELSDVAKRRALMETSPWFLLQSGDPWFKLAEALYPYFERTRRQHETRQAEWMSVRPRYIAAVQEFVPTRPRYLPTVGQFAPGLFYHDANGTLRVTFGRVDGYNPRDGLIAAAHTTVSGIREKATASPYEAPGVLLAAIDGGEWGPYADPKLGEVGVNYVTTLDTARGSSGSATIDAQGRWVGLIFDGNYESMAADWVFDDRITRSIHTDAAYVLWYLDAVAGADGLLTELGLKPALATVTAPEGTAPRPGGDPMIFE